MRWFVRIVLTLAFACLLALAALPHLGTVEQGWKDFQQAWKLVRSGNSEASQPATTPIVEEERSREVLTPDPLETTVAETENSTPDDSFLVEARTRAAADPEAAMDWLQSTATGSDRLRGMLEVVAIWAAQDSENALLWLESNAQGLARHETINSGMELWSQQDPSAAAAWIEGMANDGSKKTAAQTLIDNWVRTDPQAAQTWLEQLPPGIIRNEAALSYTSALMESDPTAAADWAVNEAIQQGNPELLLESIEAFTNQDPVAAETYIRSLQNTGAAERALITHVKTLAQNDPQSTANWIASLSQTDALYSPDLNTVLMREWSQSDSVAASTWLSEASNSPERDAAIIGFAETMIDYEPEAVAAWTNTIGVPETRVNWLTHAVQTWARSNPVETLRWLKDAELDPALRSQLAREVGAD